VTNNVEQQKPAYITIVEGPPPDFRDVPDGWPMSMLEGSDMSDIALCEMRALNGPTLVERCQHAWRDGRPARLDFPTGDGSRGELDILAVRWEAVEEGHKLYLWVKI
jgi:hypothetical protein